MFILFSAVLYVVFVVLLESYYTRKYGLCPSTCMCLRLDILSLICSFGGVLVVTRAISKRWILVDSLQFLLVIYVF